MAAGEGSRLRPLTDTTPKPLIKICGKTIIEHNIESIVDGFDEIFLIVKYKKEQFKEYFWEYYQGKKVHYIEQWDQNGTGAAILSLKWHIDGEFVVISGDDLYDPADLVKLKEQLGYATLVQETETPELFGIFTLNKEKQVTGIIEKPTDRNLWNLVNIGCHRFDAAIFEDLEKTPLSPRGELEITDLIHHYIREKQYSVVVAEWRWIAIGYPWHLLDANDAIIGNYTETVNNGGTIEESVVIKGYIYIEKGAILKSGTYIEGNIYIGENVQIWPFTHIRGNTSFAKDARAGSFSEIKWCYFGEHTIVAQWTVIVDTVAGNDVNFASGMITTNWRHDNKNIRVMSKWILVDTGRRKFWAIVGDGVRFWANTTIYPGRVIETGTTTVPGEIIK